MGVDQAGDDDALVERDGPGMRRRAPVNPRRVDRRDPTVPDLDGSVGAEHPRADIGIAPAGEHELGGRMGWTACADDAQDEGGERRGESSVSRGHGHGQFTRGPAMRRHDVTPTESTDGPLPRDPPLAAGPGRRDFNARRAPASARSSQHRGLRGRRPRLARHGSVRQRRGPHAEHRPDRPFGTAGAVCLRHLAPVQPVTHQHPERALSAHHPHRGPAHPDACRRADPAVVPAVGRVLHRDDGEDPPRPERRAAVPVVLAGDGGRPAGISRLGGDPAVLPLGRVPRAAPPLRYGGRAEARAGAERGHAVPGGHAGDAHRYRPLLRRHRDDGRQDRRDGGGAGAARVGWTRRWWSS